MTTNEPDLLIRVRQTRKDVPQSVALRAALKRLLRGCGLTCLTIENLPRETPVVPLVKNLK